MRPNYNRSCKNTHRMKWSEITQSCLTLCDPMDSSLYQVPPSIGFSRQEYWSWFPTEDNSVYIKANIWKNWTILRGTFIRAQSLQSCPTLHYPWSIAHQVPLSMGFSRILGFSKPEYWSGLSYPPPGALSDTGIKPTSLALEAQEVHTYIEKLWRKVLEWWIHNSGYYVSFWEGRKTISQGLT